MHLENNAKLRIENFENFKDLHSLSLDYTSISHLDSSITMSLISDVSNLKIISNSSLMSPTPYVISFDDYFMNLQRLDLSGLGLKILPAKMSSFLLNLREVNLSFNQLTSLVGLEGMPKLTHVLFYGNDIQHINECLDFIKKTKNLTFFDMRENQLTKRFYPNLLECLNIGQTDNNSGSRGNSSFHSEDSEIKRNSQSKIYLKSIARKYQADWNDSDSKYVKDLEKFDINLYKKRVGYQGLLVSANKNLKWLDGTILDDDQVNAIKKHWSFILGQARRDV